MKKVALAVLAVVVTSWLVVPTVGFTTAKIAKDSGKKCLDCHTAIPKDKADPKLSDAGKKFQEEQKKAPAGK